MHGSRVRPFLPVVFILCLPLCGRAVSTYTCTTFPVGMAMRYSPKVFPSSINNQAQVAGLWNVQFSPPVETGNQAGFVVDSAGMAVPFAAPAGGYVKQTAVNNVGQVAGWISNSPFPGSASTGSFISNPDGSIILVNPPVDTPTQLFDNVRVGAINDHGDLFGDIGVTGRDGIPTEYWFVRDFLGNYTLFDPMVGGGSPQVLGSLNNAGTAIFSDKIRYADGSERHIPSRLGGYFTWYSINNNGLIIGDVYGPFPVVLTPDGNAPAVACPEISGGLTAYSINDNGMIAGEAPPNQTQGTVFLATPTGFHSGATLSNTSWGFSPNPMGQEGGSGTIYVTSSGVADLHIEQVAMAPPVDGTPPDFTLTDTTCTTQQGATQIPGTFAPGQFCAISFSFTPAAVGARTGQLLVFDDAPDAPHVIRLDGTGLGKQNLLLSNSSWTFGSRPVGDTSGPGILYIYNQGTDAINFASIAITGPNSSDFAIITNTCGSVLAPYTTCAVLFQFTPGSQGLRSAAVTLIDDSPLSPQSIPIRGYGQ
jgi:hypothetical protein